MRDDAGVARSRPDVGTGRLNLALPVGGDTLSPGREGQEGRSGARRFGRNDCAGVVGRRQGNDSSWAPNSTETRHLGRLFLSSIPPAPTWLVNTYPRLFQPAAHELTCC
jgi:hypothetical protein